jgi:hypothetical protein
LIAVLAGCLVGAILVAILVLAKGWAVGLVRADYCAACGSLGSGMLVARRLGKASPWIRVVGLLVGFLVGLIIPLAAWLLAPSLGFTPGEFASGPQAALGAAAGFVGVILYGRKSKLPAMTEEITRRRRQNRDWQ